MRLTKAQIEQIKILAAEQFGPEAELHLFGSRVDDAGRGGDVDLLVQSPVAVDRPALASARLAARVSRLLHGRKVDIVLQAPNLARAPIHDAARLQGVRL